MNSTSYAMTFAVLFSARNIFTRKNLHSILSDRFKILSKDRVF